MGEQGGDSVTELNLALIEAIQDCERIDTNGNSWWMAEDDVAWTVARYLLALPVEKRMKVMGMEQRRLHDDHQDFQSCRGSCRDYWVEP